MQEVAAALSSGLASAEVLQTQACIRPLSPDGSPIIGQHPNVAGAYIATGDTAAMQASCLRPHKSGNFDLEGMSFTRKGPCCAAVFTMFHNVQLLDHQDTDHVQVVRAAPTDAQQAHYTTVTAGHSCWGILNGPATGKALAELIATGTSQCVDLSVYNPARLMQPDTGVRHRQHVQDFERTHLADRQPVDPDSHFTSHQVT